jgi:hypothetical protein
MTRSIKPRPAVVLRPSYVSDETCFAVLGIVARKFREVVVPRCERVTRLGRTVAVELDEAERVMRTLASAASAAGADVEDHDQADDDGQPRTVAEVLRRLGKTRAA